LLTKQIFPIIVPHSKFTPNVSTFPENRDSLRKVPYTYLKNKPTNVYDIKKLADKFTFATGSMTTPGPNGKNKLAHFGIKLIPKDPFIKPIVLLASGNPPFKTDFTYNGYYFKHSKLEKSLTFFPDSLNNDFKILKDSYLDSYQLTSMRNSALLYLTNYAVHQAPFFFVYTDLKEGKDFLATETPFGCFFFIDGF
jgi:hypothetical protein